MTVFTPPTEQHVVVCGSTADPGGYTPPQIITVLSRRPGRYGCPGLTAPPAVANVAISRADLVCIVRQSDGSLDAATTTRLVTALKNSGARIDWFWPEQANVPAGCVE
jgi:hypothetical protein